MNDDTPDATAGRPARQRAAADRRNASVGKAAALLRAAARFPDGTSVSALARAAALPRATALRMIDALEGEQLLVRLRDRDLVLLGTGVLELAGAVRPERLLVVAARAPLVELAAATAETVTLAARHGDEIVGLDEVPGVHLIGPATWVGRSWPLAGTASGRLARGEVAAGAVAESVDELELGLASIAAAIPLPRHAGAFVTVSGPSFRFDADARAAAGAPLLAAAAAIATRLGGPPAPTSPAPEPRRAGRRRS